MVQIQAGPSQDAPLVASIVPPGGTSGVTLAEVLDGLDLFEGGALPSLSAAVALCEMNQAFSGFWCARFARSSRVTILPSASGPR